MAGLMDATVQWGRVSRAVISWTPYQPPLVIRDQGTEEVELPVKNCSLDRHVQNSSGEPGL